MPGIPIPDVDRGRAEEGGAVAVDAAVLDILGELVRELQPRRGAGLRVELDSVLDRELGLDSLALAELLLRIERRLGVHLPEYLLTEAETPADLVAAVQSGRRSSRAVASEAAPRSRRALRPPTGAGGCAPRQRRGERRMVFFAEGTLRRQPGLMPFHLGAFMVAAEHDLPVVPVGVMGTRSVLRGEQWLPRRGRIQVSIGSAIRPAGTSWNDAVRLRDQTREALLTATGEPDLAAAPSPAPVED